MRPRRLTSPDAWSCAEYRPLRTPKTTVFLPKPTPSSVCITSHQQALPSRLVLTNREHIIALEPLDKGLMGTLLRYPYEVRSADEYFDEMQDVILISTQAPSDADLLSILIDDARAGHDPTVHRQARP
jgi:hypothetical protein